MNTSRFLGKKTWLSTLLLIMSMIGLMLSNMAIASTPKLPGSSADRALIVFVANGRFESTDGSIFKDGIVEGDGMNFQKNVMNRTDEEIETLKQEAVDFFLQRFGINVYTSSSIVFTGYEMDPRINLKAFTVSGEKVPTTGFPVDDGGWAVIVTDPAGLTLGGAWAGSHIPAGSMLLHGEVVFSADSKRINVHYESDTPFIMDQFKAAQVRFKADNEKFGEAAIGGIARIMLLDPETLELQVDIKNILTAPGILSGL